MFNIVLIVVLFGTCIAQNQPQGFYCGPIPGSLLSCMGSPKVIKSAPGECGRRQTECERIKCSLRNSGFLDSEDKLDKANARAKLEQFSKEHPEWSTAVDYVKTTCLGDLRPQGTDVNCPAFDYTHCLLTGFVKHVQPSQWSPSGACDAARQFAARCPLCPEPCFAPQVPYGSCNACLSLPRSP